MKKHIPNLITSLNLACGFFAIIHASKGDLVTASWLILAAMVFDFIDGFAARLLKAYSDIGRELDSLADVVSFGVAPGLIVFELITGALQSGASGQPASHGILSAILMMLPALMPVCAALRLAIFNLDTTQATTFKGLPTPANALAVISLILAGHYSQSHIIDSLTGNTLFLASLNIVLSLLMVSRFPLLSLKFANMKLKGNEGRFILIGLVVLSLLLFQIGGAVLIIPLYIVASLISYRF